MTSEATTLPLRDSLVGGRAGAARARPGTDFDSAGARSRRASAIGALSLLVIVLCSALIVLVSADRPSFLAAISHSHYFPRWMAGPLGGLWPGLSHSAMTLKYIFTFAILAMYAGYVLGLRYAPRLRARWTIAAVLAVHLLFLLAPPLALTDVFNYINYARMELLHHLNPYTSTPILEPHGDPSFDLSNWHQLLSPYGPLFTLLTFAVVPLGIAGSFWAFKVLLMLASLATIALVWKCARLLGRDPVQAVVFVGLNPVVLVWGLGGDHNDFIMMLLVVLAFYLLLRARADGVGSPAEPPAEALAGPPANAASAEPPGSEVVAPRTDPAGLFAGVRSWLVPPAPAEIAAGAALAAAVAVKASAAILLPVILIGLLRAPRRLAQVLLGMLGAGALLALLAVAAFGLHLPDLATQGRLVTNVSVPNLLGLALGSGGETDTLRHLLSFVLALSVLACGVLAFRRRDILTACGWATVALLVTLSWVLPWYVLWVLPLAALSRSRALRTTALVLGAYLIVAWAPLTANIYNAIGFHPEKTTLGRLHQRYVKELLN